MTNVCVLCASLAERILTIGVGKLLTLKVAQGLSLITDPEFLFVWSWCSTHIYIYIHVALTVLFCMKKKLMWCFFLYILFNVWYFYTVLYGPGMSIPCHYVTPYIEPKCLKLICFIDSYHHEYLTSTWILLTLNQTLDITFLFLSTWMGRLYENNSQSQFLF